MKKSTQRITSRRSSNFLATLLLFNFLQIGVNSSAYSEEKPKPFICGKSCLEARNIAIINSLKNGRLTGLNYSEFGDIKTDTTKVIEDYKKFESSFNKKISEFLLTREENSPDKRGLNDSEIQTLLEKYHFTKDPTKPFNLIEDLNKNSLAEVLKAAPKYEKDEKGNFKKISEGAPLPAEAPKVAAEVAASEAPKVVAEVAAKAATANYSASTSDRKIVFPPDAPPTWAGGGYQSREEMIVGISDFIEPKARCLYHRKSVDLFGPRSGSDTDLKCTQWTTPEIKSFKLPCNLADSTVTSDRSKGFNLNAQFSRYGVTNFHFSDNDGHPKRQRYVYTDEPNCGYPLHLSYKDGIGKYAFQPDLDAYFEKWAESRKDEGPRVGTLENSYLAGAMVQALNTCKDQVLDEIRENGNFELYSASHYAKVADDLAEFNAKLTPEEKSKLCSINQPAGTPAQFFPSTCYLQAATGQANLVFQKLAAVEILHRWESLWAKGLLEMKAAQNAHVSYCMNKAANDPIILKMEINEGKKVSKESWERAHYFIALESAFNACYQGAPNMTVAGVEQGNNDVGSLVKMMRKATQKIFKDGRPCGVASLKTVDSAMLETLKNNSTLPTNVFPVPVELMDDKGPDFSSMQKDPTPKSDQMIGLKDYCGLGWQDVVCKITGQNSDTALKYFADKTIEIGKGLENMKPGNQTQPNRVMPVFENPYDWKE